MYLKITVQQSLITGTTAGFGKAVALTLAGGGANMLAVARNKEDLKKLKLKYPDWIEILAGDIREGKTIQEFNEKLSKLDGILINAGGFPATSFQETKIEGWDVAYHALFRWKALLIKTFLPKFIRSGYRRIVLLESASVKQLFKNLVLGNSLWLAMVDFVKTKAGKGITLNILTPGYYDTQALERIFNKQVAANKATYQQARKEIQSQVLLKRNGSPFELASLAAWLLPPASRYITCQTISVDGGIVRYVFGFKNIANLNIINYGM